jgi:hypothetical protein
LVSHLTAEAAKVEIILYIVLIHLAEELIAPQAAKPADPAGLLLLAFTHLFAVLAI